MIGHCPVGHLSGLVGGVFTQSVV